MRGFAALSLVFVLAATAGAAPARPRTTLVTWGVGGQPANDHSGQATVSADGRYVAFQSIATNLTRTHRAGLFVRDRRLRRTERIPRAWGGWGVEISGNGRYVVFCTAQALAKGDKAREYSPRGEHDFDTYVYDRETRRITWASVSRSGRNPDDWSCVIIGYTDSAEISADGSRVVFVSAASNLIRGDKNEAWDVFVRDLRRRRTVRASIGTRGQEPKGSSSAASISANGRFVTFCSSALNLGAPQGALFVRDLERRKTTLAATTKDGKPLSRAACVNQPPISGDGRYVAFVTLSPEVVGHLENAMRPGPPPYPVMQLFVKDRRTGALDLITPGIDGKGADNGVYMPTISADGRFLTFMSEATNLVRDDRWGTPDVFVFDRVRRTTRRLNVLPDGRQSSWEGGTGQVQISDDGRYAVFSAGDPYLVPGVLPEWSKPDDAISHIFIRGPLH
jgi:Tol biopolymer transport system component